MIDRRLARVGGRLVRAFRGTQPAGRGADETHPSHVELLIASGLFDRDFYAAQAGLSGGLEQCAKHYLRVGASAGYSPNRFFDPEAYLADHPDVAASGMPPFFHFAVHGLSEGRRTRLPSGFLPYVSAISPEALSQRRLVSIAATAGWNPQQPSQWARRSVAVYASSLGNFFFRHIADRLADGLRSDGVPVYRLDQNSERPSDTAVDFFVAPHEFFHLGGGRDWMRRHQTRRSVMLNTEQPGNGWYFLAMQYAAADATLVDMSPQSAAMLHDCGRSRSGYLPLGWVPGTIRHAEDEGGRPMDARGLEVLHGDPGLDAQRDNPAWDDRPIDVLFLGTLTPRRSRALARLAPTLSKHRCFIHAPTGNGRPLTGGRFDLGRDESLALARRAKVMLNIHRDELPYFEWHRVVMTGIEQGAVVLSELSLPSPAIVPGRHFVPATIDEMPERLESMLQSPDGQAFAAGVRAAATDELPKLFDLPLELRALSFLHEVVFREQP